PEEAAWPETGLARVEVECVLGVAPEVADVVLTSADDSLRDHQQVGVEDNAFLAPLITQTAPVTVQPRRRPEVTAVGRWTVDELRLDDVHRCHEDQSSQRGNEDRAHSPSFRHEADPTNMRPWSYPRDPPRGCRRVPALARNLLGISGRGLRLVVVVEASVPKASREVALSEVVEQGYEPTSTGRDAQEPRAAER